MRNSFIGPIVVLAAGVLIAGLVIPGATRDTSTQVTDNKSATELSRDGRKALKPVADAVEIPGAKGAVNRVTGPGQTRSPQTQQEYILAEYDFDDGVGGPDPQGWTSFDATAQVGTFFHVDDFTGLADYSPLADSQSMWCGLRPAPELCNYATLPGYGNGWTQDLESVAFASSGDVNLTFLISYDTEPYYDFVYVQYLSQRGVWETLHEFDGTGAIGTGSVVPTDSLSGQAKFRFRFVSDGAWSDQDGLWYTNGAVIIDNVSVSDTVAVLDTQDFESEAPGDQTTLDGDWIAKTGAPFGDYAALFHGATVVQEDSLITNNTYLWGFFSGSTDDYGCGRHPTQPAVPFTRNPGSTMMTDYIHNQVWSPWIDLSRDKDGLPVPETPFVMLNFDVYRDLPSENLVFYDYLVRSMVDGCPTNWRGDGFINLGISGPEWHRFTADIIDLIEPGATDIQVALLVRDMCFSWCGIHEAATCHSHAPLFDNVAVAKRDTVTEFVVTKTRDTGAGSLRQAILDANAAPDVSVITFDIPVGGLHVITPSSILPALTSPVVIDGFSQPDAHPNTNGPGLPDNAVMTVVLDGVNLSNFRGIQLSGGLSTVRGMVIMNFGRNGIQINSDDNVVEGNYIGVDATGSVDRGNGFHGVYVGADDNNNRIGGSLPEQRNVISGNGMSGVNIAATANNLVIGNLIGTDRTGQTAIPNSQYGVYLGNSSSVRVGGDTPEERNVISGNSRDGILIFEGNIVNVENNFIGTDIAGLLPLGNGENGVELFSSTAGYGIDITKTNTIAFNGEDGVRVGDGHQGQYQIFGNHIHSNTGLGIDIGPDGVTPNSPTDDLQDTPTLLSVVVDPGGTTFKGRVTSTPFRQLRLQFCSNTACDPSGSGEGEVFLASGNATIDGSGTVSFSIWTPVVAPAGSYVTATAAAVRGDNTSEFSACVIAINTPTGSGVVVEPVDDETGSSPVAMTFGDVSTEGVTELEISDSGPAIPGTFITGEPPMYYDITTTATYSGTIEICVQYDEDHVPGDESDLELLHWVTDPPPADWDTVTTTVDTLLNIICGETSSLSPFILAVPNPGTGVDPTPAAPSAYALYQNVPNPFNPTTVIHYDVPDEGVRVTVQVFDVSGRLVSTLVDETQSAGSKSASWDGTDRRGQRVATGVYFYRMVAGKFVRTRKMVLMK